MRSTHLPLLLGGLGLALGAAAVIAARQQKAARASERPIVIVRSWEKRHASAPPSTFTFGEETLTVPGLRLAGRQTR